MSYTLRGRLESRVATALLPLLVACVLSAALRAWWPIAVAALMLGLGLALDALAYDRALDYQPGWLALPLGLAELGAVMALVRALSIEAPLAPALGFYVGAWLLAQVLAHAGFPLLRLSYAEDGGELGRLGMASVALSVVALGAAGGTYVALLPPTVRLSAGVHQGPLVITSRQILVGDPGAVVRGGIVIRASGVTVRDVSVFGGENGIDVEESEDVVLDGVNVAGAALDGIHVRRSAVTIRDCTINSPAGWTQGIDISFAADKGMAMVEGCTVTGGREGIVIDSALATVRRNRVSGTSMRAINMTEMSMGMIEHNVVAGALGVGIYCGDRSECMVEDNTVTGMRADTASGDEGQAGWGIVAHYFARAELDDNDAGRTAAFANGILDPLP